MTRYRWDGEQFVDRQTGEPMTVPDRDYVPMPAVLSDVTYKSPLSGREITSRSQRREEMKVHNVREVDPSEFTPRYAKKKNAIANRRDVEVLTTAPKGDAPYHRLSRADLPDRIARTIA